MRTNCVERKELVSLAHEQDCVLPHMAGQHSAIGQGAHRDPCYVLLNDWSVSEPTSDIFALISYTIGFADNGKDIPVPTRFGTRV